MSVPVKLLAVVGVVVICALGAAELLQRARASARPDTPPTNAAPRAPVVAAQPTDDDLPGPRLDYAAIARRNLFRPLAKAPKSAEGSSGSGGGAGSVAAHRPQPASKPPTPGPGSPQPADPLADLALTGVIQAGDRLQALIEKVSAKIGRYVAVNEEFEGFRVVSIAVDSVVLERDGKQHALAMGSKQLPEQRVAAAPAPSVEAPASSRLATAAPSAAERGGSSRGMFASDMLAWANSQPLSTLEQLYSQYWGQMSSEDQARAGEYLNERRERERGR